MKLCHAMLTDSQVQLVEPDWTGYSTVSADVASAEVVAPASVAPAQLSLLVEALLSVLASLVVRNRVRSAVTRMTLLQKLSAHWGPLVRTATEYNTPVEWAAALVFLVSEAYIPAAQASG